MAISMDISVKIKKQESNGESTSFSPFLRMIYHKTKLGNASSIQRPVFRDYTNFEFRETYDLRSLINPKRVLGLSIVNTTPFSKWTYGANWAGGCSLNCKGSFTPALELTENQTRIVVYDFNEHVVMENLWNMQFDDITEIDISLLVEYTNGANKIWPHFKITSPRETKKYLIRHRGVQEEVASTTQNFTVTELRSDHELTKYEYKDLRDIADKLGLLLRTDKHLIFRVLSSQLKDGHIVISMQEMDIIADPLLSSFRQIRDRYIDYAFTPVIRAGVNIHGADQKFRADDGHTWAFMVFFLIIAYETIAVK